MKLMFTFVLAVLLAAFVFPQSIKIEKPILETPYVTERWGNDILLLNYEPIGGFHGIQRADGTIYVAVNDTLATSNLGLVILKSTNTGNTWSILSGIPIRDHYPKIKMLRSGLDSVYCMFQLGDNVYCWNLDNLAAYPIHAGNYRSFDAVASSTGSLYVVVDSLPTNNIIRYASLNGGMSWINRGSISSGAAMPVTEMSQTGDTLFLNYYGPVLADTATSVIRVARYRETSPGVIASAGFQDLVTDLSPKENYITVARNGEVFFLYSIGLPGSRDLYYKKSEDGGLTYTITPGPFSADPNKDEYFLDAKPFSSGTGGFDFVYNSDSAGTARDFVNYAYNTFGIIIPTYMGAINQFVPAWSPLYPPKIVELYYSGNDVGIIYVADVAGTKKVMWDYLTNPVPVELTSFTASVSGGQVILKWATATETNNSGFEVQRLSDETWETLGFVKGSGSSTAPISYNFTVSNTAAGKYSYRLKQIDYDGSFSYSEVIEAETGIPGEYSLLQNYPNPFNPSTSIKFSLPEKQNVTIKITDALGRQAAVIFEGETPAGTHEVKFNAGGLSSGVYFYTIKAGNFVQTRKMLLIK